MGRGRPKKEIDQKTFEMLCALQCTILEFVDALEVSDKTIEKWCMDTYGMSFSEVFAIKRGKGKISLRRKQWRLADKSAAMAIWLGKQYLDQKEKPEESIDTEDTDAYFAEAGFEKH